VTDTAPVPNKLLTTREVAQIAGLSVSTVNLAAKLGELRSIRGGQGKGRRYRPSWVADWLSMSIDELPPLEQVPA